MQGFHRLFNLSRPTKLALLIASDVVMTAIALAGGLVASGAPWPPDLTPPVLLGLFAVLLLTPSLMGAAGLYRVVLRYPSESLLLLVALVSIAITLITLAGAFLAGIGSADLPTHLVFGALLFWGLSGPRLAIVGIHRRAQRADDRVKQIVVYGAGQAGRALAMASRSSATHRVLAFVDDNPRLQGRVLAGLPVHGPDRLPGLIEEAAIDTVVLAVPSAPLQRRRAIIRGLAPYPVRVQTLPDLSDLLDRDHITLSQVRDIEPQELLWRDVVPPSDELLGRDVHGKVVLVTGGGGSIGSEICRQAVALEARRVVVLDHSEFALYSIEHKLLEMRGRGAGRPHVVPVLGDVCDHSLVAETMRAHEVDVVFHAAAYKHVPMVEMNPLAGIRTNVLGTLTVARAARDCGIGKMVLISTDKAVRPTNIMGASKRFAEQILQALAAEGGGPCFTMVRFGNVIGSNGSVVPLFRRQIAAGGPVTLTHREITRYFMTIPEAVQLVLQAAAMAEPGDVFVLDMGEPVRILDLAVRLIHLSGLTVRDEDNPDGDIPIEIIGLRPGEKLYEELLIGDDVTASGHPSIMRAREQFLNWATLSVWLDRLAAGLDARDVAATLNVLQAVVREFHRPEGGNAAPLAGPAPTPPPDGPGEVPPSMAADR